MAKITSSKDLLMLLLYARGHDGMVCEPIRGRTRLMKMVFLFDKEVRRKFNLETAIPDDAIPDFSPFNFGPFSATVFADLEFLVELRFVKVTPVTGEEATEEELVERDYWQAGSASDDSDDGDVEEEFALTDIGRQFAEEVLGQALTGEQWTVLYDFKARCTGVNLRSLLEYVYARYPEMTTRSKIRDQILGQG